MTPRSAPVAVALLLACVACSGETEPVMPYRIAMGDAKHGVEVIRSMRCGSCHSIPGVRGADGVVGPPLLWWSRRTYIAGELPNTPDNLVRWIRNPRDVEPNTAMPVLGLDEQQARDVAAYLYQLR